MTPDELADLQLSHNILNYLLACYQGKFAWLNILSRLQFKKLPADEIPKTEKLFETLNRWISSLWEGVPIFSASWGEPESFESDRALALLADLLPELARLANTVKAILSNNSVDLGARQEEVKILIAAFGRYTYSQDNYVKGFVKFGELFNQPELAEQYRAHIPVLEEKVRLTHTFLKILQQEKPLPDFYQSLKAVTVQLPGKLRMYCHDISQLSSVYKGDYTFQMAGIEEEEGRRWTEVGLTPQLAGYWRAYELTPEQSAQWRQIGISSSESAFAWASLEFTPESCLRWASRNFPPAVAKQWQDAGYDPTSALVLIQQGFELPDMVPGR